LTTVVDLVYYDTWGIWNPGLMLGVMLFSSMMYLVLISQIGLDKSRSRWFSSLPLVFGFLGLGVYVVLPFLGFVLISFWIDRRMKSVSGK